MSDIDKEASCTIQNEADKESIKQEKTCCRCNCSSKQK